MYFDFVCVKFGVVFGDYGDDGFGEGVMGDFDYFDGEVVGIFD